MRAWAAGGAVRMRAEAADAGGRRARRSSGCASRSASTTTCPSSTAPSGGIRCSGPVIRRQAVAAPAAAARAVRGAGLGDLRAADRGRAARRDRAASWCAATGGAAPAGRCATRPPPRRWPAARRPSSSACGLSPKRAIVMRRAAREVASGRADLSEPRVRLAPPARASQRDRLLDAGEARLRGPGPRRQAPRRRPRLHQAGRPAGRPGPPRHRATRCASSSPPTRRYAGLAGTYALQRRDLAFPPVLTSKSMSEHKVEKTDRSGARSSRPSATTCFARRAPSRRSSGAYTYSKDDGMYRCGACGNELFCSATPSSTRAPAGPASPSPRWPRRSSCTRTAATSCAAPRSLCARCGSPPGPRLPGRPRADRPALLHQLPVAGPGRAARARRRGVARW